MVEGAINLELPQRSITMQYTAEWDTEPQLKAITDAAQEGPVFIQDGKQEVAVVISAQQYRLWRKAAVEEFQRFCDQVSDRAEANGMTEEKLEELLKDD
jgi:hypothetical protein